MNFAVEAAEPAPTLETEVVAGITTFLTMAYIVIVNPTILSTPGTGLPYTGVLTATVLVCAAGTLLMGLYANLPFGVAPGMGLNAFFTYTVVLQGGVPWPVALGMVFWAGVLFLLVSATPLREAIALAIPPSLRRATAAGIGLLLTFIGLQNAGFVVANPATLVGVGPVDHRALLTLLALGISVWLTRRGSSFAYLAGMAVVTALAWAAGWVTPPATWFSQPDFTSVFLQLDVMGALQLALLPAIVTLMMTDLFDSLSTFVGVAHASKLLDAEGRPRHLRKGLIADSFATLGAALVGSSPGTTYVESIAGIRAGGRTGRTAVVAALCFLPCLFIAPVAAAVPPYATAAVLIMVGVSMFQVVIDVDFERLEIAVPAFATLVLIPLTFSITQGILWGFILHVALFAIAGRARELSRTLVALALVSVALLVLEHST
ncbi:MAG TPA: NCS2 family permease [Vicinamibacterales bacterium]|nr:NCS2 family permease [Vicinamibacterales bacterium]